MKRRAAWWAVVLLAQACAKGSDGGAVAPAAVRAPAAEEGRMGKQGAKADDAPAAGASVVLSGEADERQRAQPAAPPPPPVQEALKPRPTRRAAPEPEPVEATVAAEVELAAEEEEAAEKAQPAKEAERARAGEADGKVVARDQIDLLDSKDKSKRFKTLDDEDGDLLGNLDDDEPNGDDQPINGLRNERAVPRSLTVDVAKAPRRPDPGLLDDGWLAEAPEKPRQFLPRMFYFENTYLGRSAAFIERLRRLDAEWAGERPYALASLPPQPVDPPADKGLALAVALDRVALDQPGRVYLQVTLQGSSRFGWRRPPLDVAVVLAPEAVSRRPGEVSAALQRLLAALGPQDRLGVVLGGAHPRILAEVADLRTARQALDRLSGRVEADGYGVGLGMEVAGRLLLAASQGQARVPGAQTVLVLADGDEGLEAATAQAHALTVQGATTSVIELGGRWSWWPVANAGHGNLHRVADGEAAAAVDAELARISQVIARLLRVNIRLAPGVQAVRVLGSRMLEAEEVRQVKAREGATDRQLSATLGVKADRGDDDDGIQTVIPFFYGGDAHVIAVELWVERPGPVAEITLKYKDMVALENATARAGARLGGVPRDPSPAELAVRRNVRGFLLAETLDQAGRMVARGDRRQALELLARTEAGAGQDAALITGFRTALARGEVAPEVLSEALGYAGQRRISHVALR